MVTRRSFLAFLGLFPFVRPAKAVTRENGMTYGFNLAYGRRAGMSYAASKAWLRGVEIHQFVEKRLKTFGYPDLAAWPGWTKEERAQHLKDPIDVRARWAIWNAWYEAGNTEPLGSVLYPITDIPPEAHLWASKCERVYGPGLHIGSWPGWELKHRLSQIVFGDLRIAECKRLGQHDTAAILEAERDSWLRPYEHAGLVFSGTWHPEFLELPKRQRPAYEKFYQDSIIEPVIDLHREMPIGPLKLLKR